MPFLDVIGKNCIAAHHRGLTNIQDFLEVLDLHFASKKREKMHEAKLAAERAQRQCSSESHISKLCFNKLAALFGSTPLVSDQKVGSCTRAATFRSVSSESLKLMRGRRCFRETFLLENAVVNDSFLGRTCNAVSNAVSYIIQRDGPSMMENAKKKKKQKKEKRKIYQ